MDVHRNDLISEKDFPSCLRGYGVVFQGIARLVFYDEQVYPALYVMQGKAFDVFNDWFGYDTTFIDQKPEDMALALCFMGAIIDEEFD